jgi:hypothetical protein
MLLPIITPRSNTVGDMDVSFLNIGRNFLVREEIGYGTVSYRGIGVSLSNNRVGLWARPTSFS